MGSLFSAPKVTNRATRAALNNAQGAANSASSNINSTAGQYAGNITNAANSASNNINSVAGTAAGNITNAANQAYNGINTAATAAANGLTGLSSNLNQYFQPLNLNAGGLTGTYVPGQGYVISSDAARQALINQLYGGYNDAATAFGNLRSQWTPGESALRAAQLQSIENARQANISDLRQNLAKRAVLGSSFAQDAQTRANMDYENQKNNVIANTYLQELDAQHQLIGDQYTAAANAVSSKINELNLQGNLGTQLTSQAQDALKSYAQLQAQLASDAAQLKVNSAVQGGQILTNGITSANQLQANAANSAGQLLTQGAGTAGQIATQGATSAGNIKTTGLTNVANTNADLSAKQAQLDASAQAGAGNLLGTLALAPITGGTSLLGAGFNLLQGNQAFPQGVSTPSNGYSYTPGTPISNYYPQGVF